MIGMLVAHRGIEPRERLGHALRECVDPLRDQMPRRRDVHVGVGVGGAPCGDRALVAGQDDRRVLRCKDHHDDASRAFGMHGVERCGEGRIRVEHARHDNGVAAPALGVERGLELAALLLGDVDERRPPDQVVAAPELVDEVRRHLAPTADRGQVGGDVIGGDRGAEGREDDAELGHAARV